MLTLLGCLTGHFMHVSQFRETRNSQGNGFVRTSILFSLVGQGKCYPLVADCLGQDKSDKGQTGAHPHSQPEPCCIRLRLSTGARSYRVSV